MTKDTIYYWVQREIREQFAERIRSVCPGARLVEYAHETDMGGENVTTDALHRYMDVVTAEPTPAAFIVDRETGSAHDPFDADQAKVRAWTSHICDLLSVVECRMQGVPTAASLMCMLPANARFASRANWREAVRRQADMGMWQYGSAHHFQIFAAYSNPLGLWMTDDFDRCKAKIEMGLLPPWPFYCQWCPTTREGTSSSNGILHTPGVLAKNIEHTLRSGVAMPQLWWPGKSMGDPAFEYMLSEVGDVMGRRDKVPVGGDVA